MGVVADLATRALGTPAIARAPIWLLRSGFGPIMGDRLLLLEHIGRRSGAPRYVCLEVVARPSPDRVVVVSGFGRRAQWLRNVRADPACWVTSGRRRRVPARAEVLAPDRARKVLDDYAREHPKAWRQLKQVIEQATPGPALAVPVVELHLGESGAFSERVT